MKKSSISIILSLILTLSLSVMRVSGAIVPESMLNTGETVVQTSQGATYGAVLTSANRLFLWGGNEDGQLGDGTTVSRAMPVELVIPQLNQNEYVSKIQSSIALDAEFTLALTTSRRLFAWGNNSKGQLGNGTLQNSLVPLDITSQFNLNTAANETIVDVSVGNSHSAVLTSLGRVFTWGFNYSGQLGNGNTTDQKTPVDITANFNLTGETITSIQTGGFTTSALTSNHQLFMWGSNGNGQIGDNTTTNRTLPTNITSNLYLNGETIQKVFSGYSNSGVLTSSHRVLVWGNNSDGQLGNNTVTMSKLPMDITARFSLNESTNEKVEHIDFGYLHAIASTSDGRFFSWGNSQFGQLGNDTNSTSAPDVLIPTEITSFFGLKSTESFVSLDATDHKNTVVLSSGRVLQFGDNNQFELGLGDDALASLPRVNIYLSPAEPKTITFESNGGSVVPSITKEVGSEILAPTAPTRKDYTFAGWYSDPALTVPFVFDVMPNTDLTLYAKWTFAYQVIFNGVDSKITANFKASNTIIQNNLQLFASFTPMAENYNKTVAFDFNNDGYEDYFLHDSAGNITFFRNQQNGTFSLLTQSTGYSNYRLWDYDLIDFDNDGDLDVFLAYQGGGIRYLQNNGNGTFKFPVVVNSLTGYEDFLGVHVRDYDLDGDYDIFGVAIDNLQLLKNNGTNTYTKTTLTSLSTGRSVNTADFNQDGFYDIVVSDNNTTYVMLGNSDGTFQNKVTVSQGTYGDIAIEDRNNNGYPEILMKTTFTIEGYEWHPTNAQMTQIHSTYSQYSTWLNMIYWKDLNNDGYLDLVGNNGEQGFVVFLSKSLTSYDTFFFSQQNTIGHIQMIDLYNDGDTYIIAPNKTNSTIETFAKTESNGYYLVKPVDPEREGHTFNYWYKDGETTPHNFNALLTPGTLTLNADWSINQYTITFNSNGGSAVPSIVQDYDSTVTEPNKPTKSGYVFAGWYKDALLTEAYEFSTMGLDTTLYAKWIESITVSFNVDGELYEQLATPGEAFIPPTAPEITGMQFAGWYEDEWLTIPYNFGIVPSTDVHIYPAYDYIYYQINYVVNGGELHPESYTEYTYDWAPYLDDAEREGYTFEGWFDHPEMTGEPLTKIPDGLMEDITLYAKWTINQYTITFDSNEGSTVLAIVKNYGSIVTEPVEPTRFGHIFDGWYSDIEFTEVYEFTTMGLDTTVYAKWIKLLIVSYDVNGEPFTSFANPGETFTPPTAPEISGMTFAGWYEDEWLTIPYNHTLIRNEDFAIYPAYDYIYYQINYVVNGGELHPESYTEYTYDWAPYLDDAEREGYTFEGWFDHPEMTGEPLTKIPDGLMEDITLYAKWTINQYTIIFDSKGGSEIAPITSDYASAVSAPIAPTRVGYTFAGWDSEVPQTMPAESFTLNATWTINQYTITFNSNGGSEVAPITSDYASTVSAPIAPTRVGYTFAGWDKVLPNTMPAEPLTLTATWTINQYTITFNSNGGSEVAPITSDYASAVSAPISPTRVGYTFAGWDKALPNTMPAENLTYEARWFATEVSTENSVNSAVNGLENAINPDLITTADSTIVFVIEQKEDIHISNEELTLITAQLTDNQRYRILDIALILRNQGQSDQFITQLDQMVSITIYLDEKDRGHQNYQIIRIHNGVAETLDVTYDKNNHTITFETDRFSTYFIVYSVSNFSWVWWIVLILVLPLGLFVLYLLRDNRIAVEYVNFGELTLKNSATRIRYQANSVVDSGYYLEITPDYKSTNRVVKIHNVVLPEVLSEKNMFIHLSKEEGSQLSQLHSNVQAYIQNQLTYKHAEGYYVEVDQDNQMTDRFVYKNKRLPSLSNKDHRWVKIERRPINDGTDEVTSNDKIILGDFQLKAVETRPRFKTHDQVKPGYYLEITPEVESTNRVVNTESGLLPKLIEEQNFFIGLSEQEAKPLMLSFSVEAFAKKTLGSKAESGYYVEVDIDNKLVDHYIFNKHQLPPTQAKGHRWVKIEKRKISN